MPPDLFESLRNPIVIGIAVAVALALILIVILLLRSRRRKREKDSRVRTELVAMEREAQFSAGAEQAQYHRRPEDALREIAAMFRDYLSMPVLAVYAGRDEDERLLNLLTRASVEAGEQRGEQWVMMPDFVPAPLMREYWRPQVTSLKSFTQPRAAESQSPEAVATEGEARAALGDGAAAEGIQPSARASEGGIVVLPWRGPFAWHGLIVAQSGDKVDSDALARYRDPLARLGDRLAVALELERTGEEIERAEQRAVQNVNFFRSLINCLDEPSPLASIAREVASLVGADSAALWRVEPGTGMVRMVAAYGLRSAEFLPLPLGQGLAGSVAQTSAPLALEDAPADPRCLFPREARESGIGSYLGVPVIGDNQTIGVIEAHTASARSWEEGHIDSLQSAAAVLADVFRSTDLRGNRLKVESAYLGLSEALQRLRSRDEVMEAAVEVLGHALGVSRAVLIELDHQGSASPVRYEYAAPDVKSAKGAGFSQEAIGQLASATAAGDPVAVTDSRERSLMGAETAAELQALSELAVPIRIGTDTRAIIYLHQCDRVRDWQPDEVEFADRVGRQLSLSLSNVESLESAQRDAIAAREEARRSTEATIRIQSFVNALPEAALGLDREGRITFFNPIAREWLGLSNDDLGHMAGMTESLAMSDDSIWDRVIACQSTSRFESQLTRLPSGSRTTTGGLRSPREDEAVQPVPVSIAVSPLRTSAGEITGYLVVLSDVSHITRQQPEAGQQVERLQRQVAELERVLDEARRAEDELRQERDRLREDDAQVRRSAQQLLEINRLKSEFIVNAGRELESSLHSVLGFAEQLEQGAYGPLTQEQHRAVSAIYGWAKRMQEDIDSLIDYGATRSRRLEPGT